MPTYRRISTNLQEIICHLAGVYELHKELNNLDKLEKWEKKHQNLTNLINHHVYKATSNNVRQSKAGQRENCIGPHQQAWTSFRPLVHVFFDSEKLYYCILLGIMGVGWLLLCHRKNLMNLKNLIILTSDKTVGKGALFPIWEVTIDLEKVSKPIGEWPKWRWLPNLFHTEKKNYVFLFVFPTANCKYAMVNRWPLFLLLLLLLLLSMIFFRNQR